MSSRCHVKQTLDVTCLSKPGQQLLAAKRKHQQLYVARFWDTEPWSGLGGDISVALATLKNEARFHSLVRLGRSDFPHKPVVVGPGGRASAPGIFGVRPGQVEPAPIPLPMASHELKPPFSSKLFFRTSRTPRPR